MKVKCSLFDGRNGVSLSISGAKLGISFGQRMGKFCFLFWFLNVGVWLAYFGLTIGTTWSPNCGNWKNLICCIIWSKIVPSHLPNLARRRHRMELKLTCHFWASFLFRSVVFFCFQLALILVFLLWIRMSFSVISFYFIALFTLQENADFPFLFEESLFPK